MEQWRDGEASSRGTGGSGSLFGKSGGGTGRTLPAPSASVLNRSVGLVPLGKRDDAGRLPRTGVRVLISGPASQIIKCCSRISPLQRTFYFFNYQNMLFKICHCIKAQVKIMHCN
jgi:hypothetical protein